MGTLRESIQYLYVYANKLYMHSSTYVLLISQKGTKWIQKTRGTWKNEHH